MNLSNECVLCSLVGRGLITGAYALLRFIEVVGMLVTRLSGVE
jgi:hypothetical protein